MDEVIRAIIEGDIEKTFRAVERALERGSKPSDVVTLGVLEAINQVGERWRAGELFIPEVIVAAEAAKKAMVVVKPYMTQGGITISGKIVIGTVKGDIHDIGKNLVIMMLEASGFQVTDLGVDVSPEKFVEAVKQEKPDIIGMSALLTTTMMSMRETVRILSQEDLRSDVKVILGGACVTSEFATQIGADGCGSDAIAAVDLCRRLCS